MGRLLSLLLFAAGLVGLAIPASAGPRPDNGADVESVELFPAPSGFREACRKYDWLCGPTETASETAPLSDSEVLRLARRIKRRVNFFVSEVTDPENYGIADYWSLPRNGSGDCEDFVLEKYRRLIEAGVPHGMLSMAIVLDRFGDNHAVLILHTATGDYVLDNLSSRVKLWNKTPYRFLAMQSHEAPSRWEVVDGQPRTSAMLARR